MNRTFAGILKGSLRMHSQPPGLSSNSINSIFLIDHCVYTVSVQCRREKLWIFCIVAVCTDRHLIGIFPISHKVLYTLAAIMSLSNYLKMYSSFVWRWWYLYIYSIFVRSYLFNSYVYCRRPKRKKKYHLNGFMCFLYSILNFVTLFKLK